MNRSRSIRRMKRLRRLLPILTACAVLPSCNLEFRTALIEGSMDFVSGTVAALLEAVIPVGAVATELLDQAFGGGAE